MTVPRKHRGLRDWQRAKRAPLRPQFSAMAGAEQPLPQGRGRILSAEERQKELARVCEGSEAATGRKATIAYLWPGKVGFVGRSVGVHVSLALAGLALARGQLPEADRLLSEAETVHRGLLDARREDGAHPRAETMRAEWAGGGSP